MKATAHPAHCGVATNLGPMARGASLRASVSDCMDTAEVANQ
jgi:hypothetical protein